MLLSSWPLALALFDGNVSGWIMIGVATMLVAGSRIGGAASAVLAISKLTPGPLFGAALATGGARNPAALTAVVVFLASFAVAPAAWFDWFRVLPSIARNPPTAGVAIQSPAAASAALGWPEVGFGVGVALAAGFTLAAIALAWRRGLILSSVAAATFAYMFASPTLWDHHVAVAVPIMIAAWPRGSRPVRLIVVLNVGWSVGVWIGLGNSVVGLAALLLLGAALVVPAIGAELRAARGRLSAP